MNVKKLEIEAKKLKQKLTPHQRIDHILQGLRVKQRNIDHLYKEIEELKKRLADTTYTSKRCLEWLESHGDRLTKQELNSEEARNDIDILITRIDVLESDKK